MSESPFELKMDIPLVIFEPSDEILFSEEPTATNSNIHFQIHRSSIVIPEEHYNILSDLFGTPSYSPDKDEPVNHSEITQQIDEQELHFPAFSSLPSPFPTLHEFSKEDLFLEDENTLTSDVRRRSPQQELPKNLTMETELFFEDEEQEDQLLSNPKTPTRPQELVPADSNARRETQDSVDSKMVEMIVPDAITIESDDSDSKHIAKNNVELVDHDSKHLQQKREVNEQDGKKAEKNRVTDWNLSSNIFTKSKS